MLTRRSAILVAASFSFVHRRRDPCLRTKHETRFRGAAWGGLHLCRAALEKMDRGIWCYASQHLDLL